MLRLLLYLAALSFLPGVRTNTGDNDISSCPIRYFGKLYETLNVNISQDKLSICFKDDFSSEMNDCILVDSGDVTTAGLEIANSTVKPESGFRDTLSQLTGSSPCSVTLNMEDSNQNILMTAEIRPFGDQAALMVNLDDAATQNSVEVTLQVVGVVLHQWDLNKSEENFVDMSGCRHSGLVFEADTVACDTAASSVVTCDASAALSISSCGPRKHCRGNGQCVLTPPCTVTGPAVIDFSGNVSFVRSRCAHTLMSLPGLQLLATFRERRRKDVSFLDQVILRLNESAVDIYLRQDGTVRLDNTTLNLDSSPQTEHGVLLSKDKNGVTAKVELFNYTSSIFFDGTTARIEMKGPPPLKGLCVNSSSSLTEVKFSELSSSSCETEHSEPDDGRINCTIMTNRCNVLKEAPFTSCHGRIDPEPYITACSDTLCRYPSVDGLRCQFLEAYVRACSLLTNDTLEGWRSETSCSSPLGFCQDACSSHEFCGEDIGGRPRCLCRADFASKYRSKDVLGDPTVCRENSASVSLAGCLLTEKGINHSTLHLNDQSCGGQLDEETHMVTFSFDSSEPCGAVVSARDNKISYKNTIKTDNSTASNSTISRQDSVNIEFSCFYGQPDNKTMSFKVRRGTVLQQVVSGSWNYSLSMKMCFDFACTRPMDLSEGVQLGQTMYISVDTIGLDTNFITLVTQNCWATNGNGNLRYDLITNGCGNPQDSSVKVMSNGNGGSVISFKIFQFNGSNSGVALNCKMKLCVKNDPGCQPRCQQRNRKRRSIPRVKPLYEDMNPAFITLAWD